MTYGNQSRRLFLEKNFGSVADIAYKGTRKLNLNSLLPYFNRLPDIDITELLPKITSPALALAGNKDPIVPPEQSKIIAERVSKGQNVLLEGAGHLPMLERQNEYNRAITNWIEEL